MTATGPADHRFGLLRLSPCFYNTEEENLRTLDALGDILGEVPRRSGGR